jgi:hypothetical protein
MHCIICGRDLPWALHLKGMITKIAPYHCRLGCGDSCVLYPCSPADRTDPGYIEKHQPTCSQRHSPKFHHHIREIAAAAAQDYASVPSSANLKRRSEEASYHTHPTSVRKHEGRGRCGLGVGWTSVPAVPCSGGSRLELPETETIVQTMVVCMRPRRIPSGRRPLEEKTCQRGDKTGKKQ